jgi:hypothetical protein
MQVQHAMTLKADVYLSTGILGRIRDEMHKKGKKASGYSLYGLYSNALEETTGISAPQVILNPSSGIDTLDKCKISRANLHGIMLNLSSEVSESIISDT